jgi:sulfite exporter TauE/SafE
MNGVEYGAAFVVGLLGSGHCVVMCGGVAAALEMAVAQGNRSRTTTRVAYQVGRLLGYAIAGAMAGGFGAIVLNLLSTEVALSSARALQAVMLILLGSYLSGLWRTPLASVERWGGGAWRLMAPLRARLLPVHGVDGAVRMGLLWGFLPCGLVYSALALSLGSGGAVAGALMMLAFGAGTLPAVVLLGALANRMTASAANPLLRRFAGVVMILSGIAVGLHTAHY